VAHTYKPSYSGGRNQEDDDSKPDWANNSQDTFSKKSITKRTGGMAQGVGLEFKPQNYQKIKKKKKERKKSASANIKSRSMPFSFLNCEKVFQIAFLFRKNIFSPIKIAKAKIRFTNDFLKI
jgi:hypothetical protein